MARQRQLVEKKKQNIPCSLAYAKFILKEQKQKSNAEKRD